MTLIKLSQEYYFYSTKQAQCVAQLLFPYIHKTSDASKSTFNHKNLVSFIKLANDCSSAMTLTCVQQGISKISCSNVVDIQQLGSHIEIRSCTYLPSMGIQATKLFHKFHFYKNVKSCSKSNEVYIFSTNSCSNNNCLKMQATSIIPLTQNCIPNLTINFSAHVSLISKSRQEISILSRVSALSLLLLASFQQTHLFHHASGCFSTLLPEVNNHTARCHLLHTVNNNRSYDRNLPR